LFSVPETVLLIDGATGWEKLGYDHFPYAVQIVDFFHAMEHLQTLIDGAKVTKSVTSAVGITEKNFWPTMASNALSSRHEKRLSFEAASQR